VILLSVRSAKEDRIEGIEVGADDYIEKPFDLDLLFAKVSNIIRQREVVKSKYTNEIDFDLPEVSTNQKDKELLETIESMVLEKLDEPDFHVQDLYKNLGFSKTFFFNKIKALTGMGPKELIRVIKLKEAARLLSTDKYNISEVCYLVGYSETNYFRTLFKNHFNMTPSDYVKKIRHANHVTSGTGG
jgi:AraC-like DNA-binding protein